MARHRVNQGECLLSIACQHGFPWKELWEHPDNGALKKKRQDPQLLFPGDEVFIPEKEVKAVSVATKQKHRFRTVGAVVKLSVQVLRNDEPIRHTPYLLEIDGETIEATTDSDGVVDRPIPAYAKRGKLIIGEGEDAVEYDLQLGALDPVDEVSGAQARLNNLGYGCGDVSGSMNEQTTDALKAFQSASGLKKVTGEMDEPTRAELSEQHDG